MSDIMNFPDTVEEFMEQYKITDTEQIYTNGTELVPIFRMKQWFEHLPSAEPHWIPVSERLPEETGDYLTTTMYGDVFCDHWQSCNFDRTEMVIAWMPLPRPYKAGENE